MDKMLNSKQEKETIYEIYRGCRLCGGGAGYKMPIIQNIIDLEDSDVELRQKIRECVQIEVHQDDKMPPLICELCVDKVNDFYEFLDMCRQTNKKTRLRLGLPPQSLPRGAPDAGDCILGLTEPVFIEDSDGETEQLAKHKRTKIKKEPGVKEVVVKKEIDNVRRSSKEVRKDSKKDRKEVIKEPVVRIQLEDLNESRFSRSKRSRTPPRVTRLSRSNKDDDEALSSLKSDGSSTTSRKRPKDKEPVKLDTPKRVKITTKPSGQKSSPRTPPKVMKRAATPPKEEYNCDICGMECKTHQARSSHQRIHTVGFTSLKLSCNPCGDWFPSLEEASYHHKRHKSKSIPYSCNNCYSDFKTLPLYDEHLKKNECLPTYEVADMKCEECWHLFPTHNLLESHRCLGVDHRPGGKCSKCNKNYVLLKNLKKHESTCTARKKGQPIVDEAILKKLLPMQVRITRCDSLLKEGRLTKCDTSNLPTDFGLDPGSFYPYLGLVRIKSEFKGMVNIEDDFKEYSPGNYLHWDSTDESDEEITCSEALNSTLKKKNIDSLTALCLKTIFSKKLLGKVPKKKRKFKPEKVFDYLNDDVKMDLDSIINNLNDENIDFNNKKDDSDSFANDNNDSGFNFDSVNGNNDSLTKFNSGNDSTPKINGDINTVNINDCAIVDFKPTDKLSVTSHSEKSQENPSEVSSVDLLMENNCQDSNLSRNSDLNKNGVKDFKFSNDCQNNDSTNDSDNIVNDNNDSSNNSKIVLSDILPKTTENDVTVNSLNNFSFDY